MSTNPFSPSFSITPRDFFGRTFYLERYRSALRTQNSADRFFFLLGTCGCGKTALLHQHALQATEEHWDVLETTGVDALNRVVHYARSGSVHNEQGGGTILLPSSYPRWATSSRKS